MVLSGLALVIADRVVSGLLPDLIKAAAGQRVHTVVWVVVAAGVVILGVAVLRRPRGFGVVLNLVPESAAHTWSRQRVEVANRLARQRHDDHVRVEESVPVSPAEREAALDRAYATLHDKLTERLGDQSGSVPVSIYLVARLHDAFDFGRRMKYDLHARVTIMQAPEGSGSGSFYPAVVLDGRLKEPLTERERRRAESTFDTEPADLDPTAPAGTVALVAAVSLSDMAPSALQAASSGDSTEYAVGPDDRCQAALVVGRSEGQGPLPSRRAAFELTVRHLYSTWTGWLAERGGAHERQLLFVAAPASVGMALGFVFARSPMRLVAHVPVPNRRSAP